MYFVWYENNGDGIFGIFYMVLIGVVFYFVYVVDLDGDFDVDILCSFDGSGVYWFENLGLGSFFFLKMIIFFFMAYMI